jgi:eukaryotic-like serine/threonine-protein kinase
VFLVDLVHAAIPLAGIAAVFGPIFYVIKRRYDLRERRLGDGGERAELEAMREERKLLVSRIENLEAIVCSVDHELNQRLARLAAEQSQARALPGAVAVAAEPAAAVSAVPSGVAAAEPAVAAAGTIGAAAGPNAALDATATSHPREGAGAVVARVEPVAAGELGVGKVVANRYRIERLLGRGGMGAVYLAHDEVLGDVVALKVISSAWAADQRDMTERFRREASAARRVSSRNVIRIHDLGEAPGGLLYISMEYFPGRTLAEVLGARGRLTPAECGDVVGQICDGLEVAHEAGVIHRDLKPQNVLVGERNAVKIIDFGLAKTAFLSGMTATGFMMGTPHYMSPEQVRGRDVDARSDLYSLGALTYHTLTGRPPFEGATPIAIGFAHCSEEPTPPSALEPSIPAALDEMILRALAKDPRQRPASAAEFRAVLVECAARC